MIYHLLEYLVRFEAIFFTDMTWRCFSGPSLHGRGERWHVLLVVGLCALACLVATATLTFGLEKSVLLQSPNERLFVKNLATEVGKLDNSEALSKKEAVIDAIKARLRAAKKSYVPFSDLADDSEVKILKSQLKDAKKQLADLMINLANQPSMPDHLAHNLRFESFAPLFFPLSPQNTILAVC